MGSTKDHDTTEVKNDCGVKASRDSAGNWYIEEEDGDKYRIDIDDGHITEYP